MAKESSIGFLPGSDPDAMKANLDYQEALMRMQEALDARKNRMFDPEMLALAAGFLAPTQTGGFGESLGYAAKNFREAQMQQEKEEREIAQAQLGLASRGIELERMRQRDRGFQQALGMGRPPQAGLPTSFESIGREPEMGARPAGALPSKPSTGAPEPSGPLSAKPSDTIQVGSDFVSIPFAEPNPNIQTAYAYLEAARAEGSISLADARKAASEIEQRRYISSPGRKVDLLTGREYISRSGPPVEVQLYDPETKKAMPGTHKVDPATAAELAYYGSRGYAEKYKEVADRVLKGPFATSAKPRETTIQGEPGADRIGARTQERTPTTQQQEATAAGMKERSQLREQRQVKGIEDWEKKESEASEMQGSYRIIRGIMDPKNPYAGKISGVFEKGATKDQFLKLLESGLAGDALAKSIREISTQAGLKDPQAMSQLQILMTEIAKLKLGASSLIKGEGSVTENERLLTAATTITEKDTLLTMIAKSEHLLARAKFMEDRARLFRDYQRQNKGFFDDFKDSAEYKQLKDEYDLELRNILENRLGIKIPSRGSRRDNDSAAQRLPK